MRCSIRPTSSAEPVKRRILSNVNTKTSAAFSISVHRESHNGALYAPHSKNQSYTSYKWDSQSTKCSMDRQIERGAILFDKAEHAAGRLASRAAEEDELSGPAIAVHKVGEEQLRVYRRAVFIRGRRSRRQHIAPFIVSETQS